MLEDVVLEGRRILTEVFVAQGYDQNIVFHKTEILVFNVQNLAENNDRTNNENNGNRKLKNNKTSVIALDVGGSSVKSGLVKSDGLVEFACHTPIDSQASKEKVLRVFVEIIQRHLPEVNPNEFLGIAIGFPGPFDYENGLCLIRGQSKYDNLYLLV